MRLHDFVNISCDDIKRFALEWQRSSADHVGLFDDDQDYNEWLRAFVLWARQEERARQKGSRG